MMALTFSKKRQRKIFNSKTLLVALAVLILLIGVPAFARGEVGRYQGIKADDYYIWIVDTETGKMRVCFTWGNDLNNPPTCGPWSKDRK